MISTAPRLPLDWTASLMVDPDDLEQVSLLTVVNPIRRDRPSADAPAVTQDDFPPRERLGGGQADDLDEPREESIGRGRGRCGPACRRPPGVGPCTARWTCGSGWSRRRRSCTRLAPSLRASRDVRGGVRGCETSPHPMIVKYLKQCRCSCGVVCRPIPGGGGRIRQRRRLRQLHDPCDRRRCAYSRPVSGRS